MLPSMSTRVAGWYEFRNPDPVFYHENDEPKPIEFAIRASLIRMGHKYAIPKIMNEALCRLKKHYPMSLSTWDDATTREGYVIAEPIDAFEVVRLARLTETPSLLPSAFFACCESMCSIAVKGDRAPAEGRLLLQGLSVQDARRLIKGRENLALVTARFNQRTLEGSFFKNTRYHAALRPLCEWFFVNPTETTGLAGLQYEGCLNFLKRTDEKLRTDAWALLPEVFDLHVNGWPSTTV